MEKGKIVRYDTKLGFGFIEPRKGNDIFFYISDVTNYSRGTELVGRNVAYDSVETRWGKQALNVIIL